MPYVSGVDKSDAVMFGRTAAQDPQTRPARLARLARSGNPELRALVARNASTPPSALAALAGDGILGIVATVAGNPSTPEATLERLASSRDEHVRAAAFGNPSTPGAVLRNVINGRGVTLAEKVAAAGNPATPIATLSRLTWRDAPLEIKLAVARNARASAETLGGLFSWHDREKPKMRAIARALAENPATPTSTRAYLYEQADLRALVVATIPMEPPAKRISYVRNTGYVSSATFELLANDKDEAVRRAVAIAPGAKQEVLELLAADSSESVAGVARGRLEKDVVEIRRLARATDPVLLEAIARNSGTPPELLPEIVLAILDTAGEDLLRDYAKDTSAPADVLRRLAQHSSAGVRFAVASRAVAPSDVLKMLALDSAPNIRAAAARVQGMPVSSLVSLVADADNAVRKSVAGNASMPPELLMRLAVDDAADVVAAVAANPSATGPVLSKIVGDQLARRSARPPRPSYSTAREAFPLDPLISAAANSNTPAESMSVLVESVMSVLARASSSRDERRLAEEAQVWAALAKNDAAPPDVLDAVARGAHRELWMKGDPDRVPHDLEGSRERILSDIVDNRRSAVGTLEFLSDGEWVARRTTTRSERDDGHTITWTIWDGSATAAAKADMARKVRREISRRSWMREDGQADRLGFAANPDASPEILDELASDPASSVRSAVAANRSTPADAFARLAADAERSVRVAAAGATHPDAAIREHERSGYTREPREVAYRDGFETLAQDIDPEIRTAVASNAGAFWIALSEPARSRMAFDEHPSVRAAVLKSISSLDHVFGGLEISAAALDHMIKTGNSETWRTLAARYGELPLAILEQLANTGDAPTAVLVAKDYYTKGDLLVRLAGSNNKDVVEAVASRQQFGGDRGNDAAVRKALIRNPHAPEFFLRQVAYGGTKDEDMINLAIKHPNFPESMLIGFAEGTDQQRIMAAASSRNPKAAAAVAANEHASLEALTYVAVHGGQEARDALLVNKMTPPELLLRLIEQNAGR
ncbi:hypothetical protein GCM10023065_16230 [Microbacterium laevaniformans]|uniref:variant leucine-rich repeat-containing protein n=1 Tax=Microbacterium laevaniformans TaxID=36807 RepID=UPI00195C13BD|nr:hypothetical protein [Microbacterium laevaniformans]MBM7752573.1 hypothetical protein [Microbacterium laevaniformans]GLJ63358.1 hypothetical protein GCM10017578_02450 [Microbacterium laevaniformans]